MQHSPLYKHRNYTLLPYKSSPQAAWSFHAAVQAVCSTGAASETVTPWKWDPQALGASGADCLATVLTMR